MRILALAVCLTAAAAERTVEFNRDVRPILSDRCFLCHGPDAKNKNIPLRLDVEAEAKKRVITPGKPEQSLLIQRVTAEKTAMKMPPIHTGLKLSETEVETLRLWIAQGARWQKHWSLIPPSRPVSPDVRSRGWVRNPIDRFVLARLEREGLKPSPEASKETLLRRVSLDLTGIPPTVAEIDAFLADGSAGAYETAVDRLLGSPRYGERMAIRWLDAARYADTNGYQFDGERVMWRWRDWVIEAFNRNLPFNQFTVEQIAGDLVPNATLDQKIATGFNRNHRGNTEDGIVPEEYAVEYVVDRLETTSTVFLGLTLGCTRCHNHKYDPFTQKEFYQLFAYFNNVPEFGRAMKYGNSPPLIPAPTKEQQQELASIEAKIREQEQRLDRDRGRIDAAQKQWEWQAAGWERYWWPESALEQWIPFEPAGYTAPERLGMAGKFDGNRMSEFAGAAAFDIDDRFSLSAWVFGEEIPEGAVMTRMADQPKGKGFGVYIEGGRVHVHITSNFADDAIRMETEPLIQAKRWHQVTMTYDGSVQAAGVKVYVDGKPVETKVLLDTLYRPFRNAGRVYRETFRVGGGGARKFKGWIDDVLVYSRVLDPAEVEVISLGRSVAEIVRKPAADRGVVEQRMLDWFYRENEDPWRRLLDLRLEKDKLERTFPTTMVMAESPVKKDTHFLIRGAYDKKGDKVEPGVPGELPQFPAGVPNDRLGFARWLVDPAHPLTARVAVNRFWQMYFGTGLVKTTEDFGTQGEWPSHPELLDWLATEFVRTTWDVKAMQKLIVTSAAYRQSSKGGPEVMQRDPDNRLLARGPRHRLPAEMIRDQALHVAGLLQEKLGGPSVKPYQPAGLWNDLAMQDMYYVQSKGPDLYRRSLYTFWKRTIAPPMMMTFDAANREACVVRDSRTNTPLQALNLMNDVTFLEAARFVGQRMMKEGGNAVEDRLRYGFRLVTGRRPLAAEVEVLRSSLQYHLDYFADEDRARKYLDQGDSKADAALASRELASYASVASLLLNLDEVVSKE